MFTFIVGMITGMIVLFLLVAIFDFDVKIEFITGKAAKLTRDEPDA